MHSSLWFLSKSSPFGKATKPLQGLYVVRSVVPCSRRSKAPTGRSAHQMIHEYLLIALAFLFVLLANVATEPVHRSRCPWARICET